LQEISVPRGDRKGPRLTAGSFITDVGALIDKLLGHILTQLFSLAKKCTGRFDYVHAA
jgi:hypothetical protein